MIWLPNIDQVIEMHSNPDPAHRRQRWDPRSGSDRERPLRERLPGLENLNATPQRDS